MMIGEGSRKWRVGTTQEVPVALKFKEFMFWSYYQSLKKMHIDGPWAQSGLIRPNITLKMYQQPA